MRCVLAALVLAVSILNPSPAAAVLIGIPDTFESGTTENWFAGGVMGQFPPVPPTVVNDGGPGGTGDAFLQITGLGTQGPGGRLVAMNLAQWAGDYTGVAGIRMDVRNLGNTDLTLRLFLENPIPGPPTAGAVSDASPLLPGGSGWTSVFFPLAADRLTTLFGDLGSLLPAVTVLRLMHSPAAGFPPDPVSGVLGVDNIEAVAVPEPATLALLVAGGAALARRRARRTPSIRV